MSNTTDLVHVVDRIALIENILNQIIEAFCEPRKDRFMFFWNVILDTSIMPTGSKVKVASAIAQELNLRIEQQALHTVMSLRNAFAHNQTDSHPVLVVGKTQEEDELHFQFQILSHSGKLSHKRRKDALAEFDAAYSDARASLVALLDVIKSKRGASAA